MFHQTPNLPNSHLLRVAVVAIALTTLFVEGFNAVPNLNLNASAASPFFAGCSPPCLENFDNVTRPALPAGWTSTISTPAPAVDLPWQTVDTSSVSSPNSAFAGGPSYVTDNQLVSRTYPAVSIPAFLSFDRRNNLESTFDGMVLEISIDGGPFVDIESAGGVITRGPYTTTISPGTGSPIAGRRAWSGNTGGNFATSVDLPASVNSKNVAFRWRVVTDASVPSTGAFLDNIALVERPSNDNIANAQPILGATGIINGSNAGATKENNEPIHAVTQFGSSGGQSVWYRWQAPATGRFVFSTFGTDSLVDTMLAVYPTTGFPSTSNRLASNDNERDCFGVAKYSRAGFDAVGGVVYLIAVDTTSSNLKSFTLRWNQAAKIIGRISDVSGRPTAPSDAVIRLEGDGACRKSEFDASVVFNDVAIGRNYNITVSAPGDTYNPWASNGSISPLTGNVTYSFFKRFPTVTIGGTVTVPGGNVSGLTVMCVSLPQGQFSTSPVDFVFSVSATINANGGYSCAALPEDGDYVVTPSKPGVRFTPQNKTFTLVKVEIANVNFSGAEAPSYTISGRVTHSGSATGVSGVSVALSGAQTASKVTDANGNYSFTGVLESGNYTVTPSNANFTFTPGNRSFNNLIANQTADFTVTFLLQLILDDLGQVGALDSVLLLRDPFPVINPANLLNRGVDRNTRVAIFLSNFQLGPGELPSSVVINLVGSNSQSYDIPAEDVRPLPDGLTRVTFRLPDTLTAGTCTLLVKARGLTSNIGAMSIK